MARSMGRLESGDAMAAHRRDGARHLTRGARHNRRERQPSRGETFHVGDGWKLALPMRVS
jgi:hypothetical protein